MKFVDEYRDGETAGRLAQAVRRSTTRPWTLMEICGGQTHAIVRYGVDELLPREISLVHGPGCPVCVTPVEILEKALEIAARPEVIFCTFGDMMRVPGIDRDLLAVKAAGGDVRMVYSPLDAVQVAQRHPRREVVFFAVGFETTAPANAMAVAQADRYGLKNFSLLVSQVTVPPAMAAILSAPGNRVQGFLAAGHVCTVMGVEEYLPLARRFGVPIVVTGFEPVDLLQGILMCVQQLEAGRAEVENAYARSVRPEGSRPARRLMREVFEVVPRKWRGIGEIPGSGLGLRGRYRAFDAERRFGVSDRTAEEPAECIAGNILQGEKKPPDCPVFGATCTPEHPLGATMVSSEGACAAWYRYRRPAVDAGEAESWSGPVPDPASFSCPIALERYPRVLLAHGGGGRLMNQLIERMFVAAFRNPLLEQRHDGAVLAMPAGKVAFTTDSYVVQPLFFPGGDIGSLAVNGTVNDLAMCGARPLYLSAGFILEEGLPMETLWRVVQSMREAAAEARVAVVTGDTKVVDRGKGDGIFVNTAGVGAVPDGREVGPHRVQPGDVVITSGDLGRHGIAIMAEREGMAFESTMESDCAPLADLVLSLFDRGVDVHCLRDLTRGGLTSALVEIATAAGVEIEVDEGRIPVLGEVQGACEILGLDPLYVANEGRCVVFVAESDAASALACLRADPRGAGAEIIGTVGERGEGRALLISRIGARRILDMLSGEQLPRIC